MRPATPPGDVPFTPLDGPGGDASVFRCPLCAARFTHAGQACPSCPVNAGCHLLTCSECGYAFPRESRLVNWIRRLAGRRPAGDRA
jgi:hypothetical protein